MASITLASSSSGCIAAAAACNRRINNNTFITNSSSFFSYSSTTSRRSRNNRFGVTIVRAIKEETKHKQKNKNADEVTQKYGLEAGLWKVLLSPFLSFFPFPYIHYTTLNAVLFHKNLCFWIFLSFNL